MLWFYCFELVEVLARDTEDGVLYLGCRFLGTFGIYVGF